MRILGPNCLGVMSGASAVYATFSPVAGTGIAKVGGIGLVSQSGAFGGFAYSLARERGLGLSHWVTTGNESDIELADCLDWLVDDDATKVILAYMEGCRDGAKLLRALEKARAARKPIVIMKVGRTELGAAAAASHTAALAGADAIYDAVFKQYGVWRAGTIEEAFDVAYAVSVAGVRARQVDWHADRIRRCRRHDGGCCRKPRSGRADRCRKRRRSRFLRACRLRRRVNPVDVTGQITSDQEVMPLAYRLMLEDGDYDSMVVFQSAAGLSPLRGPELVQQAVDMRAKYPGSGDRGVEPVHAGAAPEAR